MKNYLLLAVCLVLCLSCNRKKEKEAFQSFSVPVEIKTELKGSVVLKGDSTCIFHDLGIREDYLALLSHYGDTLIRFYRLSDIKLHQYGLRNTERSPFEHPSFIDYDYRIEGKRNNFSVWDNDDSSIRHYSLGKPQMDFFSYHLTDPVHGFHALVTPDELYGVAYLPHQASVFYSYNSRTGYYWVPGYPNILGLDIRNMKQNVYAANLCIHPQKGVIVAALRYINTINFYDLNFDMTKARAFGEVYIFPEIQPDKQSINIEKSTKCFIDIASTDKYIYCLYDGSDNYSVSSTVIILDWEGNHIRNIKVDRSLRKIVVEKSDKFLMALAGNEEETFDVVKYEL